MAFLNLAFGFGLKAMRQIVQIFPRPEQSAQILTKAKRLIAGSGYVQYSSIVNKM